MKIRYIDLAKKIAQKSTSKFRLGCVISKKNKILGVGWNDMEKTHPKCKTHGNYLHAELKALLSLSIKETMGADVYVCRIKKNNSFAMAKPCPSCLAALKLSNVRNIFYTTERSIECLQID